MFTSVASAGEEEQTWPPKLKAVILIQGQFHGEHVFVFCLSDLLTLIISIKSHRSHFSFQVSQKPGQKPCFSLSVFSLGLIELIP